MKSEEVTDEMLAQAQKLTPRQAVRMVLDPQGTVTDVWPEDLSPLPPRVLEMIANLGRYAIAYHGLHSDDLGGT